MTSLVFPDINVWIAMAFSAHVHHLAASRWFDSLEQDEELVFCRFTQLGLLRLLTSHQVMGTSVRTQKQAWDIYDSFLLDANARLMLEPASLDPIFRRRSNLDTASPQQWADSYLSSFAAQAGAALVTFDKALAAQSAGSILLKG